MRIGCQIEAYKVNGGNFMSKQEPLLFIVQNAATMSS
jgi:hypothetical protein